MCGIQLSQTHTHFLLISYKNISEIMTKYFYPISKIPSQHVLLGSELKKQKLSKSFHEEHH